jgi:hypothetical protein
VAGRFLWVGRELPGTLIDHGKIAGKPLHRQDHRTGHAPPHTVVLPRFGVEALTVLVAETGGLEGPETELPIGPPPNPTMGWRTDSVSKRHGRDWPRVRKARHQFGQPLATSPARAVNLVVSPSRTPRQLLLPADAHCYASGQSFRYLYKGFPNEDTGPSRSPTPQGGRRFHDRETVGTAVNGDT